MADESFAATTAGAANNGTSKTFAEFKKMPEWKQELLLKRKNLVRPTEELAAVHGAVLEGKHTTKNPYIFCLVHLIQFS